jgi:hypothetical protein
MVLFNSALNVDSLTGGFLTGTTTNTGQSIMGGNTGEGVESGLSTRRIINNIQNIIDGNLVSSPGYQFNQVQVPLFNLATNQVKIGESIIGINKNQQILSDGLNDQIAIRESQRTDDQAFVQEVQKQNSSGDSGGGGDPSGGFFDGLGLPNINDLKKPLLIAGAGLLALMIIPRLIKGGFK